MSKVIQIVQEDKFLDFIKRGKGLSELPTIDELDKWIYAIPLELVRKAVEDAERAEKFSIEACNLFNYIIVEGRTRLAEEQRRSPEQGGRPKKTSTVVEVLSQKEMSLNSKYRTVNKAIRKKSFEACGTKKKWTFNQAKQMQKEEDNKAERAKKIAEGKDIEKLPDKKKIFNCDFADLDIEDDSIDLIFTDPPYDKEGIPQYSRLSEWANRKLKEDGLLFAYCGHMYMNEIYRMLDEHLEFIHTFCLKNVVRDNIGSSAIFSWWKPVVCYSRKKRKLYSSDLFQRVGDMDKSDHKWQQGLGEAKWFIDWFSKPTSLVVDPFVGSGTSAVACPDDRWFIGSDIDEENCSLAKRRVTHGI